MGDGARAENLCGEFDPSCRRGHFPRVAADLAEIHRSQDTG
jgi:hypothetical protein